jgi:DNA repair photolyase
MRWSNLSTEIEQRARLPGYRDQAVVRHFEAPGSVRTRFYEVEAKSILNRVPAASRMPFRWTINPYRGCTHACLYCMWGGTRVLMADGRHVPLADISVGDTIYGTVEREGRRRYTLTRVRDKWTTLKPAYRVALADGTELITSGDHRLLSESGWQRVAKTGPVGECAELSAGERLLGTGQIDRDPSRTRWRSLENTLVETAADLRVVSIEPLGRVISLYDITTESGDFIANGVVSHNCFARPTHRYLEFDAGRDFEREIVVKINAPERLRVELARPSWQGEHVALGTNTDPYQWVEGRYRLMPGIWAAMRDAGNPCSVLTKSPLLLRDIELMKEIASVTEFSAALSVPTVDERAWRATEPHSPNPHARVEAVRELARAGIRTGVLIAPLMPGINDQPEQVASIVERATDAGAEYVTGIPLHLRGEVKDVFMAALRDSRPELVERYERLYSRGAYLGAAERQRLAGLVRGPDLDPGERMRGRSIAPSSPQAPARRPRQQRLF